MNSEKVKSILKKVGFWSMFVLLGLLLLFILMEAIIPKQTMNVFQVSTYIAKHDSKEPLIKKNDLVFINKVNPDKLVIGDLITFKEGTDSEGNVEMATYTIESIAEPVDNTYNFTISIKREAFSFTRTISSRDVVGGYSFRIPVLGSIIEFVKSPFGIGAIVVNVLIISGIIIILKQGDKPKQEVKEELSE